MTAPMMHNLLGGLHRHARSAPDALALVVDGARYDYRALAARAGQVAAWLRAENPSRPPLVGILGARSFEAIAGVLGAAWAGATYVPLGTRLPAARLSALLERVPLDAAIIDDEAAAALGADVRARLPARLLSPDHRALDGLTPLEEPRLVDGETPAYLLFTSGTTGVPKAVTVTVANVAAYLRGINSLYRFEAADRFSQFAELSFDFSVHELFVAFGAGASLWVVPSSQRLAPHEFIAASEITVWSSVPSVASMLQRLKALRRACFPSLRLTLFSGDALPAAAAEAWQAAAPRGHVDNHFGATELTVMCTCQRFSPGDADARGMVPIGVTYPEMHAALVLPDGNFAARGETGELAFSGPQVTAGYRGEPELTARRYPIKEHPRFGTTRWYLTGDLGVEDEQGRLHHLGRADNQVKVRGYRIELEDVESHLRAVTGCELVSVVAWPIESGTATGLVAFVPGCELDDAGIKEQLGRRLPAYMVPKRVHRLSELPLSANGKVDRKQLRELLAAGL